MIATDFFGDVDELMTECCMRFRFDLVVCVLFCAADKHALLSP